MTMIDVREAEAGPALDLAIAQQLDWICWYHTKADRYLVFSPASDTWAGTGYWNYMERVKGDWPQDAEFGANPNWSTSIKGVWELHDHVDIGKFLVALISVINYDRDLLPEDFNIGEPGLDWVLMDEDVWALATATAHQRTRAFLLANDVTEIEIQER